MLHTHTRLTALCPGLPRWASTRKVKPIWILLKQEKWQWNPLGHIQLCTSLQTDNHARTPPLSFLQAGCPSCRPTNSIKALKASMLMSAKDCPVCVVSGANWTIALNVFRLQIFCRQQPRVVGNPIHTAEADATHWRQFCRVWRGDVNEL